MLDQPLLTPTVVDLDSPGSCPGFITTLIERCAAGDEEALGRLVDLFLPAVLGLVGPAGPSSTADELAVETFRRVWLQAPSYDPRSQRAVSWVLDRARGICGHPDGSSPPWSLPITG